MNKTHIFATITGWLLLAAPMSAQTNKGEMLLGKADSLYGVQQYKEACQTATEALPLCKGTAAEADCLNLLAVINIRLSDYTEAAKYAKQCYTLDQQSGDPDLMSSSLNTLAAIYMGANQPQEAEKYVLLGIEQAEKANNPNRKAIILAMASEVYHALGNDSVALPYIEKAYELDKEMGNEPRATIRLAQKASILIGLHDYHQAELLLQDIIPLLRESSDKHSLAIACNKMGMVLLSQQREKEAVPYYREAADLFTQMGDIYNEVHSRRGLYESLWESDPVTAKTELDRFNELKDSIYNNTSAEKLAKYNAEFGNEWLQIENHEERQAKERAILIAILSILLLLILTLAIWLVMRRRHQRQQAINEQLTSDIRELREKYHQLNLQYDNAILTTRGHEEQNALTPSDRDFLDKAVNTVNELINNGQLDATSVAKELGLSLFQFRQRLTAITGETPQAFVQIVRMRRARHLLDHHRELNIFEIAQLCAYNDTPSFTRAFKKTFGITPTQYLDRQDQDTPDHQA